MGLKRGRLPLLVPWRLGPAPRGLATAPQLEQVMGHPCQRPLTLCSAQPPSHKPSEPLSFLDLSEHRLHQYTPLIVQSSASLCQQLALHPVPRAQSFWYTPSGTPLLPYHLPLFPPGFPILGVFRLNGQSKRDSGIIVRFCKASQSPVYPIRDAFLAVNHASCPSLSSSGPRQWGEGALKTSRLPGALSLLARSWLYPPSTWRRR